MRDNFYLYQAIGSEKLQQELFPANSINEQRFIALSQQKTLVGLDPYTSPAGNRSHRL